MEPIYIIVKAPENSKIFLRKTFFELRKIFLKQTFAQLILLKSTDSCELKTTQQKAKTNHASNNIN